jgi:outer membrane immunogenic protein
MKRILLGAVVCAFAALPAVAADLPARVPARMPPPAAVAMYNWSGFYIGVHGGYAWGESEFAAPVGAVSHDLNGFVFGGQTGINWQVNQFVFGFEGLVSLDSRDNSSVCLAVATCRSDVDHFWRVGPRLGFAFGPSGNWLAYVTGGFARANIKTSVLVGGVEFAQRTHHHGWYGGGGVEYAITPNFILGAEGYFVSLGEKNYFNLVTHDVDFAVVQARASYKFNWGGPVVARY